MPAFFKVLTSYSQRLLMRYFFVLSLLASCSMNHHNVSLMLQEAVDSAFSELDSDIAQLSEDITIDEENTIYYFDTYIQ